MGDENRSYDHEPEHKGIEKSRDVRDIGVRSCHENVPDDVRKEKGYGEGEEDEGKQYRPSVPDGSQVLSSDDPGMSQIHS
jgi:hypothetical protein